MLAVDFSFVYVEVHFYFSKSVNFHFSIVSGYGHVC